MNKLTTVVGVGAVVLAAAVAGGAGVAFALSGGDDNGNHGTMTGMSMQMDPAAMQSHMRAMLGEDAFGAMQDHMVQALGEEGYAGMLGRMAEGCATGEMAMSSPASDPAEHLRHHPVANE